MPQKSQNARGKTATISAKAGGLDGADFTVGAVYRSGEMGNFFCGRIVGLAVYERALTPAEVYVLAWCE